MNSPAVSVMQNAIVNFLKKQAAKYKSTTSNSNSDNSAAVQGKVDNGKVIIGNKSYDYEPVVDVNYKNGDYVWCLITNSNSAIIVGT